MIYGRGRARIAPGSTLLGTLPSAGPEEPPGHPPDHLPGNEPLDRGGDAVLQAGDDDDPAAFEAVETGPHHVVDRSGGGPGEDGVRGAGHLLEAGEDVARAEGLDPDAGSVQL